MATPRVAAGAVVLRGNSVLMVRPTYKDYWDIPGGYVEPGESPKTACRREIQEELGVTADKLELAAVDWAPNDKEGDKILFLFADPDLHEIEISNLRFLDHELAEARYVDVNDIDNYTIPRLARRLIATANALISHQIPLYLEHGEQSDAAQVE